MSQTSPLDLETELVHVTAAREAELVDATVFYAGRLLEALSAEVLVQHGLTPSNNAYGNLLLLNELEVLSDTQAQWAHALRRLGNAARHLIHPLHAEDADWSIHFLDRWLAWYRDTNQDQATEPPASLAGLINQDIRGWLEALDGTASQAAIEELARQIIVAIEHDRIHSSTPSTVLLERLIGCNSFTLADHLAKLACSRWPDDRRLGQLQALNWSRQHKEIEDPETRRKHLLRAWESMQTQSQDEEGLGIAGGIAKRIWQEDPAANEWLDKARSKYESGWKQSGSKNTYLGINAAATALWSGREAKARKIAYQVEAILNQRAEQLARHDPPRNLRKWDSLSIAEAQLIQGHRSLATTTYANVLAGPDVDAGMRSTSQEQANHHDRIITGQDSTLWELAPPPENSLSIAITGHRHFAAEHLPSIITRLDDLCAQLLQTRQTVTVTSGFAVGADRLFPEAMGRVAQRALSLSAMLPFERLDYEQDFEADDLACFRSWLSRCASIQVASDRLCHPDHLQRWRDLDRRQRVSGYAGLALCLANHCDLLVAIWDGKPARGAGGTAEVIDRSRELGKTIWWLNPETDEPAIIM